MLVVQRPQQMPSRASTATGRHDAPQLRRRTAWRAVRIPTRRSRRITGFTQRDVTMPHRRLNGGRVEQRRSRAEHLRCNRGKESPCLHDRKTEPHPQEGGPGSPFRSRSSRRGAAPAGPAPDARTTPAAPRQRDSSSAWSRSTQIEVRRHIPADGSAARILSSPPTVRHVDVQRHGLTYWPAVT